MLQQRIREARDARADGGFTLIELLIVIVILGILAGIVVFGVATFRSDAQLAACKADLKTVQVASDAYYASKGSYATAIGASGSTTATELTGAGYLKAAPASSSNLTLNTGNGAVTSTTTGCVN